MPWRFTYKRNLGNFTYPSNIMILKMAFFVWRPKYLNLMVPQKQCPSLDWPYDVVVYHVTIVAIGLLPGVGWGNRWGPRVPPGPPSGPCWSPARCSGPLLPCTRTIIIHSDCCCCLPGTCCLKTKVREAKYRGRKKWEILMCPFLQFFQFLYIL